MLTLNLASPSAGEVYDEETSQFRPAKTIRVELEHSLLAVSKWEEKYEKPFLSETSDHTEEEILDYLRMMVVTPGVDDTTFDYLTTDDVRSIQEYITKTATATTIRESKNTQQRQIITSELIYYWMFSLGIPKECESWNLNRLLMLIRVFNAKQEESDPKNQKSMSQAEIMARNRALNAKRLAGGRRG